MRLTEEQAADLAARLLNGGKFKAERFGAGKFSEVFAVKGADREYVLRVAPEDDVRQIFYEYRMMRQEPAIHCRLKAETSVPVPEILAHDFSRKTIARDFLIMPRLPGTPLSEVRLQRAPMERAFREWGGYVRQIHGIAEPQNRFGYVGEHRCMEPQASWRDAFLVMYRKLLDDIASCGVYDERTADLAFELVRQHSAVFEHCTVSRLCHGDLWITNLLVMPDGHVTGVLDFDRACWGDIEWDLAIAEYCSVTRSPFWEGYGTQVQTATGDAAIRRFFYLLYEHQKYIVISISSRRNDPHRARRYATECLNRMEHFRRTGQPIF